MNRIPSHPWARVRLVCYRSLDCCSVGTQPSRYSVGLATVSFFQTSAALASRRFHRPFFNEQVLKELAINVPDINVDALLAAGTTDVYKIASPQQLPGILQSYNVALMDSFYLDSATSAIAFLTALALPWMSMKGKNLAADAA
jgi:hypothetical protein